MSSYRQFTAYKKSLQETVSSGSHRIDEPFPALPSTIASPLTRPTRNLYNIWILFSTIHADLLDNHFTACDN
jgi:hypothetical protein